MLKSFRPVCRFLLLASGACFAGWMVLHFLSSPDSTAYASPPRAADDTRAPAVSTPFVVLGYNELGMHCMNQDFSEMCILPPYNTLRAQVIDRRGEEPRIVTSGVSVKYAIPRNTISTTKTKLPV